MAFFNSVIESYSLSETFDEIKEKAGTAYGNDQLTYKTVSREAKQSENEVSENRTDDTN